MKPIIERLFKLGRKNKEIVTELKGLGFKISLPTLKRRLQAWDLKRSEVIDRAEITEMVRNNIEGIHADAG
jgi:predicted PolB exonuclease-like 3'-5' exonuclease